MSSFLGYSFGFIPVSDTNASSEITGSGTVNTVAKFTAGQVIGNSTITDTAGAAGLVTITNQLSILQPAATSGTPIGFLFTAGAHTTLATGVEAIDATFNLKRSVNFATGNLTQQRAFLIQAPVYTFVGASIITTAATVAIENAPSAGSNATIVNAYSLWIQAGKSAFGGGVLITATGGAGFLDLGFQSSAPATGSTKSVRAYSDNNGDLSFIQANDGFVRTFTGTLTANRSYTFPDASGVVYLGNKTVQALTQATTTLTWNVSNGQNATVTLTQSVTTFTISNPVAGEYYTIKVIQGGTGSYTLVMPANSKVGNGGAGVVSYSTAVGSIDILTAYYDGTNYFWTYTNNFS